MEKSVNWCRENVREYLDKTVKWLKADHWYIFLKAT